MERKVQLQRRDGTVIGGSRKVVDQFRVVEEEMSSKESGNKVMMTTQVKTVFVVSDTEFDFLAAPSGVVSGFSFVGPDDVLSFRKLEDSHHWDFNQDVFEE